MTTSIPSLPDPATPSISDIRYAALGRRISASKPLAIVLADLAFGSPRRDDLAMLMCATAARIAAATGAL